MEIITPQDYHSHARKRQRRSQRPCDACRKRKTRCVTKDGDGDCVHCQLRSTACTFQHDPPERPSLPGGGIISSSGEDGQPEDAPPVLKESASDLRTFVSETQSVHSLQSPADTRASQDSGRKPVMPIAGAPTSVPVLEPLEAGDRSMGASPTRFAELYGLGSDMEPILMRHRPYDAATHEFSLETHAIRRVLDKDFGQEYPLTFHMAADEKAVEGDPTHSHVDAIEACVRPHGPSLVELFWRHVQPCYPILSKDHFILAYNQSYRNIPAALLGAVYLSSIRWWTYDPELSIRNPPDGTLLRKLLRTALPSSYHRPKLYSIQAALLLLQCQPEDPLNPDHTFQWGLTCQALAIGQCLGLHLDASNWSIPQWERNVRKRLSWALFMQDRWTALAYGRPVHIHDDDWTVQELTHADFSDYDTPASSIDEERRSISTTGKAQYMHMVQLTTHFLSNIYSNFYTARGCQEQDTVILWQRSQHLISSMQTWYASIPPMLHMNIIYQRKLCFHGYLHLSYYGTMITLLRRLVRSTAMPPRCMDDSVVSEIRQLSLQIAQSAMNLVLSLRPDHLEAFWYFTSPYLFSLIGSFLTLLLVTSLSTGERNFWQEMLNSYLWTLRTMSKSHEPMQYAVNRLEGAILRGLEHALAVNLNEPMDDKVSPLMANYVSDVYEYTDFGDWDLANYDSGAFDLLSAMALQSEIMPQNNLG